MAETDLAAFMEMATGFCTPTKSPLHPTKAYPRFVVAVKVTNVPGAKFVPAGLDEADPPTVEVSVRGEKRAKLAVTALLVVITTDAGFAVPNKSPVQPVNTYPVEGVAVKLTVDPEVKLVPRGDQDTLPPTTALAAN